VRCVCCHANVAKLPPTEISSSLVGELQLRGLPTALPTLWNDVGRATAQLGHIKGRCTLFVQRMASLTPVQVQVADKPPWLFIGDNDGEQFQTVKLDVLFSEVAAKAGNGEDEAQLCFRVPSRRKRATIAGQLAQWPAAVAETVWVGSTSHTARRKAFTSGVFRLADGKSTPAHCPLLYVLPCVHAYMLTAICDYRHSTVRTTPCACGRQRCGRQR
jgi:hypothetical protein